MENKKANSEYTRLASLWYAQWQANIARAKMVPSQAEFYVQSSCNAQAQYVMALALGDWKAPK